MPQNTDNYVLRSPEKLTNQANERRPNLVATDLHIDATDSSVEVLGIDGMDPKGPTSPHGLGIDADGVIDITGINVKPGETVKVRLKHTKSTDRLTLKYHWTYSPPGAGNGTILTLAMLDEQQPGTNAFADAGDLRPLLEALLDAIGPLETKSRRARER